MLGRLSVSFARSLCRGRRTASLSIERASFSRRRRAVRIYELRCRRRRIIHDGRLRSLDAASLFSRLRPADAAGFVLNRVLQRTYVRDDGKAND